MSAHSDASPRRPRLASWVGSWGRGLAISAVVMTAASAAACSSSSSRPSASPGDAGPQDAGPQKGSDGSSGDAAFCTGGFVRNAPDASPVCEGLCKPSLCANANNVCVDNHCALSCTSDLDCEPGQSCAPATEDGTGTMITTCQPDGKGGIGTKCPLGNECSGVKTCADGSACSATGTCSKGTCQSLTCVSSGPGDSNAYCALVDCHADEECSGGYWCDPIDTPVQICGSPTPDPFCGTTTAPCVDPANDTMNGTTYAAGNICTLRNECRLREACSPCSTDLDCSRVPGQHCSHGSCAADCNTDSDCITGFQCTSGECVPRSGSCSAAAGKGKLCETCQNDTQCGAGLVCAAFEAGGLRTCVLLLGAGMACTSDSQCPKSPSGLSGICADARLGLSSGEPGYDTCFLPFLPGVNRISCWAQNKGASCGDPTDCLSGQCVGTDAGGLGICQ